MVFNRNKNTQPQNVITEDGVMVGTLKSDPSYGDVAPDPDFAEVGVDLAQAEAERKAQGLILPAIERVDLTAVKTERKATALKRAHLLSMEPGESIAIEKRSQWAAIAKDLNDSGQGSWKFYTVSSGVRLARGE